MRCSLLFPALLVASGLAATVPATTHAAAIRYDFGGVITHADATSGVQVGQRFSGSFSYDPDHLERMFETPNHAKYRSRSPLDDVSALTIEVDGQTVYRDDAGVILSTDSYPDGWAHAGVTTPQSALHVHGGSLDQSRLAALLFANRDRVFLPDFMTPASIDLIDFTAAELMVSSVIPDSSSPGNFSGKIDTLAPHPVPEPAWTVAVCLGLAGAVGVARNRRNRRSS